MSRKTKIIQKGDLVIFDDKHRLICGDSTLKESYKHLDKKAAITFTSPPYNVGRDIENAKDSKYINTKSDRKSSDDYLDFLLKTSENAMKNSEYLFLNIQHISGNKQSLIEFNYKNRYNFVDTIIWHKTTSLPAMQPNVLNSDFEYIYIYRYDNFNDRNTRLIKVGNDFRGTISNVYYMNRNVTNEYAHIHTAMFTLELAKRIVDDFTNKDDVVIDNFSGLGTTLMACLHLDRVFYGIELEPYYVEETIKRFLEFTTKTPINIKIIRDNEVLHYNDFKHLIDDGVSTIFDFMEE